MYKISVPATTANLGPGFDCFGLALDIYNNFYLSESEYLRIEGCEKKYCNENNLVYKSAITVFKQHFGRSNFPKGMYIKFDSNIPISRGLGSSATSIIAGVLGANLLLNQPFSQKELFKIAVDIEGHSDNIASALFGGLTVSKRVDTEVYYKKLHVHHKYGFYILIPNFELSTKKSRSFIPSTINFEDAASNTANASLMLLSLKDGDSHLLRLVSKDLLHEPYRKVLIKNYEKLRQFSFNNGALACQISGAGPSILCITENCKNFKEKMEDCLKLLDDSWQIKYLGINYSGTTYEKV
ncbi:MAG: homoserine kinase [Eubacteriaceae bacterium]